jgi:hypothetical protein
MYSKHFLFLLLSFFGSRSVVFSQFSVNISGQRHSDLFVPLSDDNRDKPFVIWKQFGAGASWQKGGLNVYASLSGTGSHKYQRVQFYPVSSYDGQPTGDFYRISADVAFLYVGARLGVDYVMHHKGKFNVLIGGFAHLDKRAYYRQKTYEVSRNGEPTTNFKHENAVDAKANYFYWGLQLRPRFWISDRLYAELQLGLCFYYQPRTSNNVVDYSLYSDDQKNYYANSPVGGYASNELGIGFGYRLAKKKVADPE